MKRLLLLGAALLAAGCVTKMPQPDGGTPPSGLTSFKVTNEGVFQLGSDLPAPVVKSCTLADGGAVPGTPDCPYAILKGEADFAIRFVALDANGDPLTTFNGPVSFRVVPGDLAEEYVYRWANVVNGEGQARVRAGHVFGQARVWVEDRPPEPIYVADPTDQNRLGTLLTDGLPQEPAVRTNASGLSPTLYFQEPTLAALQEPSSFDNTQTGSQFRGTFVTVGRAPAAGQQLLHDCPTDPERHGQPLLMVVTGIDSSGFFVTDVNSCRIPERIFDDPDRPPLAVPEPDGKFPGTFGSVYVYNYNHPDGLNVGDALWALTGSIQEFTSTTQLVFASWNIADSVRLRPQSQWNLWLDRVPVPELNARTCGFATTPHLFDVLCGHTRENLKLESLESALVKVRNVKLPEVLPVCDRNADNQVEFFCTAGNPPSSWTSCPNPGNLEEIQCHIDCQTSQGPYARTLCSEGTSFNGFGQLSVEMAGPGPAAAGLDASVAARTGTTLSPGATPVRTAGFGTHQQVRIWCNGDVHYAFGGSTVNATTASAVLPADTLLEQFIDAGQGYASLLSTDAAQTRQCTVVVNPRTKLLTILRDAVPEVHSLLGCNPDGTDARAEQCRFMRAARYDITGHLRQVQPARPRWMVIPRDVDDVCCHPGPGLSCPTPIQPCE